MIFIEESCVVALGCSSWLVYYVTPFNTEESYGNYEVAPSYHWKYDAMHPKVFPWNTRHSTPVYGVFLERNKRQDTIGSL